jgi:hypothetical protein
VEQDPQDQGLLVERDLQELQGVVQELLDPLELQGVAQELQDPQELQEVEQELQDPQELQGVAQELQDPQALQEVAQVLLVPQAPFLSIPPFLMVVMPLRIISLVQHLTAVEPSNSPALI